MVSARPSRTLLSEWLDVTVYREGQIYNIRFHNGGAVETRGKLEVVGKTQYKHGSTIRFKPDAKVFHDRRIQMGYHL
jgi:topoisomerase-4 subunit B